MVIFGIALPGYWVATYFMDSLGRKNIQMIGFSAMSVLYCILGSFLVNGGAESVGATAMLLIYGLTYFFR
jgi:PHS family inorganic phosphate transporter-like MFS transporter